MKAASILGVLAVILAVCTLVFGQSRPAGTVKWEYAVAATLQSEETKDSLASWKVTDAPVVSIRETAKEENSQGNALASLAAKLLGKQPLTGFPGASTAGLLQYAGDHGWELITVESHPTYKGNEMIFIFKRPAR